MKEAEVSFVSSWLCHVLGCHCGICVNDNLNLAILQRYVIKK